jgi:hypothetical protein
VKTLRLSLVCGAAFVAAILLASTVHAAPIFAQTPSPNNAFPSDREGEVLIADDFSLAASDTAKSVSWLGVYGFGGTASAVDDFEILFYENMAGAPGALLQTFAVGNAANRTPTGDSIGGFGVYAYAADLGSGFSIAAATSYWLVIVNDTIGDPDDAWYWAVERPAGNARISIGGGPFVPTSGTSGATSFVLDNANIVVVPEPASVLLAGIGLAITVVRRRLQQR